MFDDGRGTAPGSRYFRGLSPHRLVWFAVGRFYPLGPPRAVIPDGLDLQAIVPGELAMWNATTTGHWVGWVRFKIHDGHGGAPAGQWVPGDAIEPRREGTTK